MAGRWLHFLFDRPAYLWPGVAPLGDPGHGVPPFCWLVEVAVIIGISPPQGLACTPKGPDFTGHVGEMLDSHTQPGVSLWWKV